MRKLFGFILSLIVIFVMTSCTGSKKSMSSGDSMLSFEDKKNFQYAFFNANREKILGNISKAQALFEQCLKMDINNAAVIYELAKIYGQKNEDTKALVFAKRAVDLSPTNEWYCYLLGGMYEKTGKYKNAAAVYENLVSQKPFNVEYYYYWANALIFDNDYNGALEVFNKMEREIGVDDDILLKKQKIYLSIGDIDAAIAETEKLIANNPSDGKYYSMLAEMYLKKNNEERALEIYQKQLEQEPDNPYVHLSLSEFYSKKGHDEKAHEALLKAFKSDKLSIDPKVRIVLGYFTLTGIKEGKEKEAYELAETLVNIHNKDAKSHSIFGDLLYRVDSLEPARKHYRISAELDNSKYVLWSQILLLNSELRDYKSMLHESEKAIELFPTQPTFYLFKGMAAVQTKQYDSGIKALNTGKEFVFDNPGMLGQFFSTLGDAYHAIKAYNSSDSAYEKALEIDPENIFVLNNYSYYLSLRRENLDRAVEMSSKCVEKEPKSPTFADTHAWVLYQKGDYGEAKKWLEIALENGAENNGVIIEHYGDVLYQLNDKEGAIKQWERAKSIGGTSDKIEEKIKTQSLAE